MARLDAFYSFDMSTFDFSAILYNGVSADVALDVFLPFGGRVIEDFIAIEYLSGDAVIGTLIGGAGFTSDGTRLTGGTVTLIGESLVYPGGTEPLWVADRINVPLVDLFGAMMTPSTVDDRRMVERAFGGNDVFNLSNFGDVAFGHGGNDLLHGNAGNDVLWGGAGNDTLFGGGNNDRLLLDQGNDVMDGGLGIDWLAVGGARAARIDLAVTGRQATGHGQDIIRGIENVGGGSGADALRGNAQGNLLRGQAGNDLLSGRSGADRLEGGFGNDILDGGLGRDILLGGGNTDRLIGGAGADVLTGGLGADVFVFRSPADSRAGQTDLITDFRPGTDRIDLSGIDANIRVAGNQRFDFDASGTLQMAEITVRHAGGQTQVLMDINGDGRADGMIRLAGTLTLSEGDFIL